MNEQTPAQKLINNDDYRFTIRETGGKALRKFMTGARFVSKRDEYKGRSVRVDITNMTNGTVQTWDLTLTKWYGSN